MAAIEKLSLGCEGEQGQVSRRGLLVSAAGAVSWLLQRPAAAAPQDRIVVGVMGLQRGLSLAETFVATPGVELRYLCDVDQARQVRAGARLERLGVTPRVVGEYRRILDDPDVDALVCAAPNHWHATATIQACQAGKHVYVEKPCSHTPAEGEWMIEAAQRHHCIVQVGTQRRSSPAVRDAIERLRAGAIGQVFLARSWYFNKRRSIGKGQATNPPAGLDYEAWLGPAPRVPYRDNLIHYNWHWFWDYGNGELGNNGVHGIDLCCWGLGVDFPSRVVSAGGRYWYHDDQQTPDTQTVTLAYGDRQIEWIGQSCNAHGTGFVSFYGDQGALEIDSDGGYRVFDKAGRVVTERPGSPGRGQEEHVANFVAAIRSGTAAELNAGIVTGHQTALACHLGNISQRLGRPLDCDAATGSVIDDPDAGGLWSRTYEPGWNPVS